MSPALSLPAAKFYNTKISQKKRHLKIHITTISPSIDLNFGYVLPPTVSHL